jgi:DNA-binding FrmR family transcriptional regulator
MANTKKEEIIHRLKIAEGHLKKVREMVENDQYCVHVIQQSSAVQSALKKVDHLILDNHMHTCVTRAIKENGGEAAIQEILEVFSKK